MWGAEKLSVLPSVKLGCCHFVWGAKSSKISLWIPESNKKEEGWKWLFSLSITTAIFLGSFRLPYEEIRDIVLEVDEERLSESLIQVRLVLSVVWLFFPSHAHTLIFTIWKQKKRVWYSRCVRGRRFPLCSHGISVSGSWLGDNILNAMRSVFRHKSGSSFTRGPQRPLIHLLTMDDEGQALAKSLQLLPPFLLFCL